MKLSISCNFAVASILCVAIAVFVVSGNATNSIFNELLRRTAKFAALAPRVSLPSAATTASCSFDVFYFFSVLLQRYHQ